jgi:hypothetical protein
MFKKIVALTVLFAFISLIGASAYPLHAQETPGAVEKLAVPNKATTTSSIVPYILIGVGVIAVGLLLFLVILKTSYDIVGTWDFSLAGQSSFILSITFSGSSSSGTWNVNHANAQMATPSRSRATGGASLALLMPNAGEYSASGKTMTMSISGASSFSVSGQFSGADTMTGTWTQGNLTWNWTATRGTAPAVVDSPLAR